MTTEVYGASDDLIEIDGDIKGEHPAAESFLFMSDGTILKVKYGKSNMAVWDIKVVRAGSLFKTIKPCFDEDADRYSDTAVFDVGIKWAYAADNVVSVE